MTAHAAFGQKRYLKSFKANHTAQQKQLLNLGTNATIHIDLKYTNKMGF